MLFPFPEHTFTGQVALVLANCGLANPGHGRVLDGGSEMSTFSGFVGGDVAVASCPVTPTLNELLLTHSVGVTELMKPN